MHYVSLIGITTLNKDPPFLMKL